MKNEVKIDVNEAQTDQWMDKCSAKIYEKSQMASQEKEDRGKGRAAKKTTCKCCTCFVWLTKSGNVRSWRSGIRRKRKDHGIEQVIAWMG